MGRKKSILFGSIFVLALILLMPSLPAIEQKTIEDKTYSDFEEEIDFEDIEVLDDVKLPLLYTLVMFILETRYKLVTKIMDIAADYIGPYKLFPWDVHHPILFIIGFLGAIRALFGFLFWIEFSDIFRLDWDILT